MAKDIVGSITIHSLTIRGRSYGAVPVLVTLGGTPIEGFAVRRDGDKWVSSREDCLAKLVSWGLTDGEAVLLLELGTLKDRLHVPALPVQEESGQLWEELVKIADGVEEAESKGELATAGEIADRISRACQTSAYANDRELLAVASVNLLPDLKQRIAKAMCSVITAEVSQRKVKRLLDRLEARK